MNTLSRAITARFFPHPDSYNALRQGWSDLINSDRKHELSAVHHLLYLALMGKDWRKAFTPPTNQRKLDNGAFWSWGLFRAVETIHRKYKEEELLSPFAGLIIPEMLNELRRLLPMPNPYSYKQVDFANGAFPFDAYVEKNIADAIAQVKGASHE